MKRIITLFLTVAFYLSVGAQDYKVTTFKQLLQDLSASTNPVYDINNNPAALIKVLYPKPNATFDDHNVIEAIPKDGEYWVYVPKGTQRLKIHLPEQSTITLEFKEYGIPSVESKMTYAIEFKKENNINTSFYIEGGYVAGTANGVATSIGLYIGDFNVEADMLIPTVEKETIYWMSSNQAPIICEYKPSLSFGGKIGYGIMTGESVRITPQVGFMYMELKETKLSTTSKVDPANGANSASLTLGCKIQWLLSKSFALSITPEYKNIVAKSKGFDNLSEVSDNIKKWNNGISVKLALNVEF